MPPGDGCMAAYVSGPLSSAISTPMTLTHFPEGLFVIFPKIPDPFRMNGLGKQVVGLDGRGINHGADCPLVNSL